MVAGEAKELTSARRGGGRGRATTAAAAGRSENPQLLSLSKRRSLHGVRAATQQWVEDRARCREDKPPNCADVSSDGGVSSRTPSKKEGRVQFKQENDHHSASKFLAPPVSFSPQNFALGSLRKDGVSDAQAAALSPINLNSLPGFRQEPPRSSNSTSKLVALPDSSGHQQTNGSVLDVPDTLTGGKILLQQAVPCVRNEGGERKVVWCNPAFCEDFDDRRFSNESAASATATTARRCSPASYLKSAVQLRGSQEIRRQDEKPPSSAQVSGRIDDGVSSPEKVSAESSPGVSAGAVAGSPAIATMSTLEGRGRSLRAHFELESASVNWYTPVMSSITSELAANSRCLDRFIDCFSTRTRRTLAHLPSSKDGPTSQPFFSSTAHHHLSGASTGLAASAKDDTTPEENHRRRPPIDCDGSDRRSSRKLAMQPVVDEEAVKSQKSRSRVGKPTCRGGDVTCSGRAQGPAARTDFNAMVEADLEADIAREMEEEIAKEILYLSQRLAALHAKQEQRRVAWGEKVGNSCPQTPLRCAPSPARTPPPAAPPSAIDEQKPRAASESKRRSGRVVAAKFLQPATTAEQKGVQSVERSSRRRLLADSSFVAPLSLPRRSLGTPARLLAPKFNPVPNGGSPEHHCTEQGLNSKCQGSRSKVSAEEYVRERSSADARGKSKSIVLKEVFREDLETSRLAAASSNHDTCSVERSQQQARSLSIGSAVQSRYFPEFERKIDWVKTLRSDTIVPSNPVGKSKDDNSVSRQTCKDVVVDIHTWLGENQGNAGIEEETSTQEIETERELPIHPPSSSSTVQRRDQSSSQTPGLKGRAIQQQPRPVPFVSPSPAKAARHCTTPNRYTPSSSVAAAAVRSCSPSVRARSVPSRYGTPVRPHSQTPGTGDLKRVADPKLVLESPVRKIAHTLRSAGKESASFSGTKGRALVKKPTIRKGYPGVAGLMPKAEHGDTDADVHCSRRQQQQHQHHHPSPVEKAEGGRDESMKNNRKDNFEAEYEKFVESSEMAEKQVSELYHAAMENESAAEAPPELEIVKSINIAYSSSCARPAAAKRTFIRCGELIKAPAITKGKRASGQSVLPPTDGQEDSDESVMARSLARTGSSEQDLEWELIIDERSADEERRAENGEVGVTRDDEDESKRTAVWNGGSAIDAREESLIDERQRLSKIRAKSQGGRRQSHDDESPRDSGCVKRTFDQQKVHLFSKNGHWNCSDDDDNNGGGSLWPDEVERLDFESFWCLAGEVKAPITLTRP